MDTAQPSLRHEEHRLPASVNFKARALSRDCTNILRKTQC